MFFCVCVCVCVCLGLIKCAFSITSHVTMCILSSLIRIHDETTYKVISLEKQNWIWLKSSIRQIEDAMHGVVYKCIHIGGPLFLRIWPLSHRFSICKFKRGYNSRSIRPTGRSINLHISEWEKFCPVIEAIDGVRGDFSDEEECYLSDSHCNQQGTYPLTCLLYI